MTGPAPAAPEQKHASKERKTKQINDIHRKEQPRREGTTLRKGTLRLEGI
jgi:hypothetical protein